MSQAHNPADDSLGLALQKQIAQDLSRLSDREVEALLQTVGRKVVRAGDSQDHLLPLWFGIWSALDGECERRRAEVKELERLYFRS